MAKKVTATVMTHDSGFTVKLTIIPAMVSAGHFQPDGIAPGWAGQPARHVAPGMMPPMAPEPAQYQPPAIESNHAFTKIDEALAFIAKQVEEEA